MVVKRVVRRVLVVMIWGVSVVVTVIVCGMTVVIVVGK
jgi:hypothetical protein